MPSAAQPAPAGQLILRSSGLAPQDQQDLRRAAALLEQNHLVARIAGLAGVAVERLAHTMPPGAHHIIEAAAERALRIAMSGAAMGVATPREGTTPRAWLSRRLSAGWVDKTAVGLSGLAGGVAGLPGTLVELPLTTTMMLRGIAQIAASEGADLANPQTRLDCLSVFALGSPVPDSTAVESGYYAVRLGLADALGRITGGTVRQMLPPIVARFSVPVGWKLAGQALPLAGAAVGAMINVAFMDHFQDKARGHFIVRRLEQTYGAEAVQKHYGV